MLDKKAMQDKIQDMIDGLEFVLIDIMQQTEFDAGAVETLVDSATTKVQMAIDDLNLAMNTEIKEE